MTFVSEGTFHYYIPDGLTVGDTWVCFDLDGTLTYAEKHLYPQLPDDVHLLPRRRRILRKYADKYTIFIFTNQKSRSPKEVQKKLARLQTFIDKVKVPVIVCVSTGDDNYRKPNTGMYDYCTGRFGHPTRAYFCGDAGGRPGDFSDSDRLFAENSGLVYKTPEQVFKPRTPRLPQERSMVVFVGMPGVGKTTFYQTHLNSYDWVNQDTLKTMKKCLSTLEASLKRGSNVCIDSTNPSLETRQNYYTLANKYNYTITVIYFTGNGYNRNQLRDNKVPDIVYHLYFKKLSPPTRAEGTLIRI